MSEAENAFDPEAALRGQIEVLPDNLDVQVQKVKEIRQVVESRTQELHELQVDFNTLHKDLIEALCKARGDCAQEEDRLRSMTLQAFAQDPTKKKPAWGVSVTVRKGLKYDPGKIKDWAIKTNPNFLTLQEKDFTDYALPMLKSKQNIPGLDLGVVEIVEKPHVVIAREL